MNSSGRYVFYSQLSSPFYKDMSSGVGEKIKIHQRSFKNKYLAAKFCKRISDFIKQCLKEN